jgi:FixJ family two-component response regulator
MTTLPLVHVIDDDIGVRNSLRYLMESASLHVCLYESGEAFLESFDSSTPGCIVIDLRMPAISGLVVLQQLRAMKNEIPAIVISGHADVSSAINIMKLGAVDLLQKPFDPLTLLQAVRGAIEISIKLHQDRLQQQSLARRLQDLTPRETELLKLVVSGRSNKQIAVDMGIAFKTVVNHRANLMAKTQANNAADLARISTMAGIPLLPDQIQKL